MQKYLEDNDTLMYSIHNDSKSVVTDRFTKTFKSKVYIELTVNDCKSCLGYFSKLVEEYNNTCHRSFSTNNQGLSKRIFLAKVRLEIGQGKYLLLILC